MLRRPWFACKKGTSDEQTRPGKNPRVTLGLESHFGPVRHEWLYRIAPKIIETHKPYHDDNVGGKSVGKYRIHEFIEPSDCVVLWSFPFALIYRPMEFALNVIFFVTVPCLIIFNAVKNIIARCRKSKKGASACPSGAMNNTNKCFSTHDMQVRGFYVLLFSFLYTVRNCTCKYQCVVPASV